jgi:alkyl hydroperoxide reductase subunit D
LKDELMSLDALREKLPDYAKDLKLNLGALANETLLTEQQKWGCFLAAAHAGGVAELVRAFEAEAETRLTPEARQAAKAAAAIKRPGLKKPAWAEHSLARRSRRVR